MNTAVERHNWTETEEKSLVSTANWVSDNLNKDQLKQRGGKWKVISGFLNADIGLKASDNACRKRFSDIKKREKKSNGAVTLLGVDFPQEVPKTEEEKLKARVAKLERQVLHITNAYNNHTHNFSCAGFCKQAQTSQPQAA